MGWCSIIFLSEMLPTKWFIFCQSDLLLTLDNAIPTSVDPPSPVQSHHVRQPLPSLDGYPCVGVRIDHPITAHPELHQVGLRETFALLPAADFKMAGKARELLHWDENTRFCGVCGAPTKRFHDIAKRCTHCGKEHWPNVATAVIILIDRPSASRRREDDEVLLVQSKNFRGDYYGVVAGFVETGETLEEAAHREIQEETGITVKNLRYIASQPWPFPSVLMVGFRAEYAEGNLQLQTSELRKGGWFRRSELPAIPGKVSLARRLIELWLGE